MYLYCIHFAAAIVVSCVRRSYADKGHNQAPLISPTINICLQGLQKSETCSLHSLIRLFNVCAHMSLGKRRSYTDKGCNQFPI